MPKDRSAVKVLQGDGAAKKSSGIGSSSKLAAALGDGKERKENSTVNNAVGASKLPLKKAVTANKGGVNATGAADEYDRLEYVASLPQDEQQQRPASSHGRSFFGDTADDRLYLHFKLTASCSCRY